MNAILGTAISYNVKAYQKQLNTVISKLVNTIYSNIQNYQTTNNVITMTPANVGITNNAISSINMNQYNVATVNLVNKYDSLVNKINNNLPTNGIPLKIKRSDLSTLQSYKSQYLQQFNILGQQAKNKVISLLSTVTSNAYTIPLLLTQIQKLFKINLYDYTTTYAQLSQRQYIQAIQQLAAQYVDVVIYQYLGPNDSKTRPDCQRALRQKYFTQQQKDAFQIQTQPRYKCRHVFVLVRTDTSNPAYKRAARRK